VTAFHVYSICKSLIFAIGPEKWHSEEALVEEIKKRSGRPSAGSADRPFQKKFRTFALRTGFLYKAARQTVEGAPSAVPAFVLKMAPASQCTSCHFSGPANLVKLHYLLAHNMMPFGDPEALKKNGPWDLMDGDLSPIPVPASLKYPTAGVRVEIHSLVAAAHYNGCHGELVEYVLASDRCLHLGILLSSWVCTGVTHTHTHTHTHTQYTHTRYGVRIKAGKTISIKGTNLRFVSR
jgi:hypothetical protein